MSYEHSLVHFACKHAHNVAAAAPDFAKSAPHSALPFVERA